MKSPVIDVALAGNPRSKLSITEEDEINKALKTALSAMQYHDYMTAHKAILGALRTLTQ